MLRCVSPPMVVAIKRSKFHNVLYRDGDVVSWLRLAACRVPCMDDTLELGSWELGAFPAPRQVGQCRVYHLIHSNSVDVVAHSISALLRMAGKAHEYVSDDTLHQTSGSTALKP
jgi:hypothetical protein